MQVCTTLVGHLPAPRTPPRTPPRTRTMYPFLSAAEALRESSPHTRAVGRAPEGNDGGSGGRKRRGGATDSTEARGARRGGRGLGGGGAGDGGRGEAGGVALLAGVYDGRHVHPPPRREPPQQPHHLLHPRRTLIPGPDRRPSARRGRCPGDGRGKEALQAAGQGRGGRVAGVSGEEGGGGCQCGPCGRGGPLGGPRADVSAARGRTRTHVRARAKKKKTRRQSHR